ncbi:MAG: ABC transporter substrate-binding protein [Alphaproteobacteria bacterium]|nr:ABC transporter substrate-binding protein [Alphaproteobacteria bacterium]
MSSTPPLSSGWSRRGFLGGAAAGGAALAGLPALGSQAQAATPKKGGHLRVGIGHGSTTDSLDPGTFENDFTIGLGYTIHNHLAEINADGDLVGEIAESWEASDDASVWTFKLRSGVEFHNGKSVTAEDVIASVNHHRGEDTTSAVAALLAPITDIKADGSDRIVVELEAGNADFPFNIADYHVPIVPVKDGKADVFSGIGCGPYTLSRVDFGVRADFERNPNYWKSDRAHFDSIERLTIADASARTNALVTGQIDLMDRVDLKTAALLKRNQAINIDSVAGAQHYTFPMLTNMAPFDNPDVRMALKLAVNRQELVDKILLGYGSIGNDHPIGRSVPFAANDLPQRAYDPDQAKFHVQKSGVGTLKVALSAADAAFAGAVDAAVLYQESAKAAGIEIEVVREPNDGYWSNVWTKKPFCACYWGGRPTVDAMLSLAYVPGAAWNDTNWENDRFVELITAGRAELDQAKRAELYFEAQSLLRDDGGTVVPMYANYVFASSDKLQHGPLAANWDMDGHKYGERWWFA